MGKQLKVEFTIRYYFLNKEMKIPKGYDVIRVREWKSPYPVVKTKRKIITGYGYIDVAKPGISLYDQCEYGLLEAKGELKI